MRRLTVALACAVALAGCGWFGGDDGNGKGGGGATSLSGMLTWVPDTPENRGHPIFYGNLARVRGGASSDSGGDDVALLLERSSQAVFMPSSPRSGLLEPEFAAYAGFDSRAMDAVMEFGLLPDHSQVFVGRFDTGAIESGLRSSPGGDQLAVTPAGDTTVFSLGSGGSDVASTSPIRRLGEPLVFVADGKSLVWTRSGPLADNAWSAHNDGLTSLADDAQYASVATALDGKKIVNGVLLTAEKDQGWQVGGLGEVFDQDGGSTLYVVLAFPDETAAEQAVDRFRAHIENDKSAATGTPWASTLTVTEVVSEQRLLIATLQSTDAGVALNVVLREDNLLRF